MNVQMKNSTLGFRSVGEIYNPITKNLQIPSSQRVDQHPRYHEKRLCKPLKPERVNLGLNSFDAAAPGASLRQPSIRVVLI